MMHRLTCAICGATIDLECDDVEELLQQWRTWLRAHGCGRQPNEAQHIQ